jgi:ATP-dependent exoDNAse (exonuclease V) beta subunit
MKVEHNGRTVTFEEARHIYRLDDGTKLTSGTTFVHKFFPKFDAKKVSFFYARKHGLDQQQVLAMWREKGERARMFGTNVHACAEYEIRPDRGTIKPMNEDEALAFKRVRLAVKYMGKFLEFIEPEMIVFSPGLGVAGTIDLIARHKETGEIYILDWKTNESIDRENKYGTRGLEPISDLFDCSFAQYSLQVSLYQYILIKENYFPDASGYKRALIHVNQNIFKWIDAPYLKPEIEKMAKAA